MTRLVIIGVLFPCNQPALGQLENNYWMKFFVISGIIKRSRKEGKCYQPSRRHRLITLKEILIIKDIKKTESSNCFIVVLQKNNEKHCRKEPS